MRKKILAGAFLLLIGAIIFYSCRKERSAVNQNNYNVRLIPQILARSIAQRISIKFLQLQGGNQSQRITGNTTDIPNRQIADSLTVPDSLGNPALYIFNYTNDSGFVVISAEAKHEPICAFIEHGHFGADTVPPTLVQWFDATVENIEMVRAGTYENTNRAHYAWYDLINSTDLTYLLDVLKPKPIDPPVDCESGWTTTVIGPLVNTTWGQRCTYNEQCPQDICFNVCFNNTHTPTGCVATGMNQILRYWAHPNQYHYDYVNMPNASGNAEVQRMMRDAGNSVGMTYRCSASGANDYNVADAFKNTFDFSSATGPTFWNQSNYSAGSYLTVQSNLSSGWPVLLGGYAKRRNVFLGIIHIPEEGHLWVCDGYWQTQNECYSYLRFHMNWGWHETWGNTDYNGWYLFNEWNPNNRNFQYAKDYIYNIHP